MQLKVQNLKVAYGHRVVLNDISFEVSTSEVVVLKGRNGSGRSTLLKNIAGYKQDSMRVESGSMLWNSGQGCGQETRDLIPLAAYERSRLGISWLPESKEIFNDLTVEENLLLGLGGQVPHAKVSGYLEPIYARYPLLKGRLKVKAGALSGGEQQLLAFARAVISPSCSLLLLDEPTEGLAVPIIQTIIQHLSELRQQGMALLLVDQNDQLATAFNAKIISL